LPAVITGCISVWLIYLLAKKYIILLLVRIINVVLWSEQEATYMPMWVEQDYEEFPNYLLSDLVWLKAKEKHTLYSTQTRLDLMGSVPIKIEVALLNLKFQGCEMAHLVDKLISLNSLRTLGLDLVQK